jgi:hypothetical protein
MSERLSDADINKYINTGQKNLDHLRREEHDVGDSEELGFLMARRERILALDAFTYALKVVTGQEPAPRIIRGQVVLLLEENVGDLDSQYPVLQFGG